MATTTTCAKVCAGPFSSSCRRYQPPNRAQATRVRCVSLHQEGTINCGSRRFFSISLICLHWVPIAGGKTLDIDQPQYSSCRISLRSGPAASLRVNIRAVAQYASESGNGKAAFQSVDQCLRALEDLDSLLLHASRNDPEASVKSMKAKIVIALDALDSLLGTVPSEVFDKGKAIADAYYASEQEDITPDKLDPEMKQLESIL